MTFIKLSQAQRLYVIIGISCSFFIAEISVGFYTHSLALIADAFHYLSDLAGFAVALAAILISRRGKSPKEFSFGWQRARLLGAFFNGVFLAALGLSIFLQSLERFVSPIKVEQPKLVLITGAVGLTLNIISAAFLHEHGHDHGHGHDHSHGPVSSTDGIELENVHAPRSATEASFDAAGAGVHTHHRHTTSPISKQHQRDLGIFGVFLHVIGDAINNIGVIASAAAIWWGKSPARFYADPAVGMGISLMIFATSMPLIINSGKILLESAPAGMDLEEVRKDLEELPGIASIHELHVWRLSQQTTIASLHAVTTYSSIGRFMEQAQQVGECLHAYGIHSFTVQPELMTMLPAGSVGGAGRVETGTGGGGMGSGSGLGQQTAIDMRGMTCRIKCQEGVCEEPQCCD